MRVEERGKEDKREKHSFLKIILYTIFIHTRYYIYKIIPIQDIYTYKSSKLN
jgi:hypothetical protein|tara:strand:- start:263 stop:418 length:156 start_codon:yes stop_codon:yes gene_type:complete